MSHWIHFKYNPIKGRYERKEPSRWRNIGSLLHHLLSGIVVGVFLLGCFIYFAGSPAQWRLEKEQELLKKRYDLLDKRLDEALVVLNDIGQRDDNLYRAVLQGDPIGEPTRKAMLHNHLRYDSLLAMNDGELAARVSQKMAAVERQLYLQSKSFDEVVELYRSQGERLRHVPSIQPVSNKDMKYLSSGYGWRIDPVYHVLKHHNGMDFSAGIGTEVFATGDGRVVSAGYDKGFGLCILIDHGYGYETRYAHLSKKYVSSGQHVKRGDKIGLVGSTGKSTGPHLHYEVWLYGHVQNPANYYFMDLTPEQYEQMIETSDNVGQVMD